MREDQRYIADSLRTTGIGLVVSGIVGVFFGKAPLSVCATVFTTGIVILLMGFYYVRRRSRK